MASPSGIGAGRRPGASNLRRRDRFRAWGPLLCAVVILLVLILFSGLEVSEVRQAVERFSLTAVLSLLALTAMQIGLSTVKWLIALRASVDEGSDAAMPTAVTAYHFTTLGGLLTHVLPVHVSTVLTRAAALAGDGRRGVGRGAMTSVYEQGFDALIAALAFPAGVAFLLGAGAFWSLALLAASLSVSAAVSIVFAPSLLRTLACWLRSGARNGRAAAVALAIADSGLTRPAVLAAMFALSLLRLAGIAARLVVIWWVLLPDLPVATFLATVGVVQGALLVAVTPGGLGLAEAGWTGVLAISNVPIDDALFLALAVRLTSVASLVALAGVSTVLMLALGRLRRSTRRSDTPEAIGNANG